MILRTAYLALCPRCGRHGQVFASDGSHSWVVRSKIQAREVLGFFSEQERITAIEVTALRSIIDESTLPEQYPGDFDHEFYLDSLAGRILAHKERIERGEAPEDEVMPWELDYPTADPRQFLLARPPQERVVQHVVDEPPPLRQ